MSSVGKKAHERLEGRVAQLLNERELVINIGESDGVRVGMKFKVLSKSPVEIHDPETNTLLGKIDREKVRVKAVDVKEKFSICSTYRTHDVGGGPLYGTDPDLFAPPRTVRETLKAEGSEYLLPLPEKDSYVKRGDRVIELVDQDE